MTPRPREVSFGEISGWVGPTTQRLVVLAGRRLVADEVVRSRHFDLVVRLPRRDVILRVAAFDGSGHHAVRSVGPIFGLPTDSAPRLVVPAEDPVLGGRIRALVRSFPGVASVYVEDLRSGRGAAWNARARYPAASTLKLPIAIETMRRLRGRPPPGSTMDRLLHDMLVLSDNEAANELETWLGGSVEEGAEDVDQMLDSLGLDDSHLYGGFLAADTGARPIPLTVEDEPLFGAEKYTTAWDLARLAAWLHLAAGGRGPLVGRLHGFTPRDARFLLFVLAHSADHGKLDRYLAAPGIAVLHKAGWIESARHDNGLVYWRNGAFVATVMTWNDAGVGQASDELAGDVAKTALSRFRAFGRLRRPAGPAAARPA